MLCFFVALSCSYRVLLESCCYQSSSRNRHMANRLQLIFKFARASNDFFALVRIILPNPSVTRWQRVRFVCRRSRFNTRSSHTILKKWYKPPDGQPQLQHSLCEHSCVAHWLAKWRLAPPFSPRMAREGLSFFNFLDAVVCTFKSELDSFRTLNDFQDPYNEGAYCTAWLSCYSTQQLNGFIVRGEENWQKTSYCFQKG